MSAKTASTRKTKRAHVSGESGGDGGEGGEGGDGAGGRPGSPITSGRAGKVAEAGQIMSPEREAAARQIFRSFLSVENDAKKKKKNKRNPYTRMRDREGTVDNPMKWLKKLEFRSEALDYDASDKAKEEAEIAEARKKLAERRAKAAEYKKKKEDEAKRALFCDNCGRKGDHASTDCPEIEEMRRRIEEEKRLAAANKAAIEEMRDREHRARSGIVGHVPKRSSFLDEVSDRRAIEDSLQMDVDLHTKQYGPDHKKTQASVLRLVQFYRRRGDLEECELLFQKMADEREAEKGPFHVSLLNPLIELGKVLVEEGKNDEAYYTWERVHDIQRVTRKPHSEVALTRKRLVDAYIALGGTKEGIRF